MLFEQLRITIYEKLCAGLQRCGKSCRLRWTNYLRPDIKRGRFSFEEEETIIQLHSILGNKYDDADHSAPLNLYDLFLNNSDRCLYMREIVTIMSLLIFLLSNLGGPQ